MFNSQRNISRGINEMIHYDIQSFLWRMIDQVKVEKDYLQVFEINKINDDKIQVLHSQEVPEYSNTIYIDYKIDFDFLTIFVIDEGDYCTMLLKTEY